jgi:hypothetical protein
LVLATLQLKTPTDWSSDDRFVLFESTKSGGSDLWALPISGDRTPFPIANTDFNERHGQFSPDVKWMAYQSDESGRAEIYLQPFPGPGDRIQVSPTGGAQPRWRRDAKELFYMRLDGRLMAVPIQITGDGRSLQPGAPIALFATRTPNGALQPGGTPQQYAVSADGQRFLVNTLKDEGATAPITLILNWKPKP